jgi:hypothetical protein
MFSSCCSQFLDLCGGRWLRGAPRNAFNCYCRGHVPWTSFLGKFSGRKGLKEVTPKGGPVLVPLVATTAPLFEEKEHGESALYRRHTKVMPYNTQRRLWPPLVSELTQPPLSLFSVHDLAWW